MNVYDQAARYAAKLDPHAFFAWILREIWEIVEFASWLDTRTLPFPGEKDRTCDTVAHFRRRAAAAGDPTSWAVPVEFQSEPEPGMLERLLEYAIRLRREVRPGQQGAEQYEIAGLLVNLTGRRRRGKWRSGFPRPSRATLTWAVEVRTMAQEDAAGLLADMEAGRFGRTLLPWVPLMKGAGEPAVIEAWKRIAAAEPDGRKRSDYGALAVIFVELTRWSAPWKEALKGWNMKESPQVLQWQEEAREEGRKEGREAMRASVLRTLEVRFGEVPQDLRARIQAESDLPTLSRWLEVALSAADLDAVHLDGTGSGRGE